ncbi:hypothetical protein Tco_0964506 [Tanacetum coccineum]
MLRCLQGLQKALFIAEAFILGSSNCASFVRASLAIEKLGKWWIANLAFIYREEVIVEEGEVFYPVSKRRAFWNLNEDILKITILKTNTPYPSRKIRRIHACTHQRPQRNKDQYAVSRGLNTSYSRYGINMIFWKISSVFKEEKAHRHDRVFDWQTATYGKFRVEDDLYDLRSMEAEFPAIIIDDAFEPQDTLQCKSQVSTLVNDEIDFRISFDESNNEDYTIIYDKDLFSYKMIFVNNLKTDSENDNEKVIPLIPSPEPVIRCFDDLDFFKDFENEFLAIVYYDAQTSK